MPNTPPLLFPIRSRQWIIVVNFHLPLGVESGPIFRLAAPLGIVTRFNQPRKDFRLVNVFVGLLFERFIGIYSWRRKRAKKMQRNQVHAFKWEGEEVQFSVTKLRQDSLFRETCLNLK